MKTNAVKAKLRAGEAVFGCFVRYPEPALIEMLGYYGWDYLMFDGEHSTITPRDCENLCRAAELRNVSTFVRVTTNQQPVILRFLDTGAQGAMIPMINSVAEAEAAVRSVKYPPRGSRGLAGVRAADYGQIQPFSFPDYIVRANDETMIIAQIETAQAVEALPEIVKLPDIDVFFIGPTDLSTSLGAPGDLKNPRVQAAFDRIIETVNASDKALGILVPNADAAMQWMDRGARFVLIVVDALLGPACRNYLQTVRGGNK
ncbi:MAG: HpcH/HpaI aldolase family protein [Blastocatellia bacterium]